MVTNQLARKCHQAYQFSPSTSFDIFSIFFNIFLHTPTSQPIPLPRPSPEEPSTKYFPYKRPSLTHTLSLPIQRSPNNPVHQQKLGMRGPSHSRIFTGAQLSAMHDHERAAGPGFTIWLINAMTPLPDNRHIIGVHPCLICGKGEDEGGGDLYSTMIAIEAVDPATLVKKKTKNPGWLHRKEEEDADVEVDLPPMRRLGDGMLFKKGEVQYGNFACVAGIDGWMYLFGADCTGMKLARVPCALGAEMDRMADRGRFEYYHAAAATTTAAGASDDGAGGGKARGGEWRKGLPLQKDSPTGNILNWSINPFGNQQLGPDTGDVWFDPYHNTMMMVFMSKFVDGQFWGSYALDDGRLDGPWSEPVVLWTSPVPKECKGDKCGEFNYQGHAHPGWDPSGRTLLLSYSSCARFVSMAKLTWE